MREAYNIVSKKTTNIKYLYEQKRTLQCFKYKQSFQDNWIRTWTQATISALVLWKWLNLIFIWNCLDLDICIVEQDIPEHSYKKNDAFLSASDEVFVISLKRLNFQSARWVIKIQSHLKIILLNCPCHSVKVQFLATLAYA